MATLFTVCWENAEGNICSSETAFEDSAVAHQHAMAMGGWVETTQQFKVALRAPPERPDDEDEDDDLL